MKKTTGFILVFILICLSVKVDAQLTSSPYSLFGAGLIQNYGFGTSRALGGTGYAFSSGSSLNNLNPASYDGIDSLVFLFEFGVFGKLTKYDTYSATSWKYDGNLQYLAIGFKIKPWWGISAGIAPFSSVGYKINSSDIIEGDLTDYDKIYKGVGGINNFYLSNSVQLIDNLSVGVNLSYMFGSIVQSETGEAKDDFEGYYLEKSVYVHSWYIDYGLQYSFEKNGWNYSLGLVFGDKKKLNSSADAVFNYLEDTSVVPLETEDVKYKLPRKYGVGIGISHKNNFRTGFDFELRDWSDMRFTNSLLRVRNSERYSFGMEYNPKKHLRDKGFKNLNYRIGATFEKTYLIIDQVPLNSKAITFGLGVPLRKNLSNVNFAFEYGNLGTTSNGLIKENYWLMHFNFSLRSIWFQRSKYD